MKVELAFLVAIMATCFSYSFDSDLDEHWDHFKNVFKKSYRGSEDLERRLIWEARVRDITQHNLRADLGIHSFRRGLNKYSDLRHEEYISTLNGFKATSTSRRNATHWSQKNIDPEKIPAEVDWRKEGLVTPVKDQADCGACWAFSSTGALEGQLKKKTGKLVPLSEQNLIDCVSQKRNGCSGGFMDTAFEYVKKRGIDSEDTYPYLNKDGHCSFKKSKVAAKCTGFVDIPPGDEQALKQAVATVGPISVGINARHEEFHTYKSGIYDQPNCGNRFGDLTHAVLVVGYGTEDGVDYWLVKNSWGLSYGMSGYVMMSRNKNNQCGIATQASFPLM